MKAPFCWEHKDCTKPCPARDSQSLFCWRVAMTEGFRSPEACRKCDYRLRWLAREFSLREFIDAKDRRRGIPRGRKRILVVDDEPNILFALEETVRAGGYDCLGAIDGEEALFLARETAPDLVVTDVVMPRINGYELCRTLKGDERTSRIPVILVTVRGMKKDIGEGERSGADAYLVKPFHPRDLEEKIGALIGAPSGDAP